jgi:hypothetical protein
MADATSPPRTPFGIGWSAWILIVAVLLILIAVLLLYRV